MDTSSSSGFLGLLAYFSVTIVERMQWQRMVIIDLPMSIVYGGVALRLLPHAVRQVVTFGATRATAGARRRQSIGEGLIVD